MIPQNELGVIVLFAQQATEAGFEIISIQTSFPDAMVEKDGQTYRVEFEYQAANFVAHKHDVRKCDLIVCWENDYPESILPVLSLADNWQSVPLDLPTEAEREAVYWRQRALLAESKTKALQSELASGALRSSDTKEGDLEKQRSLKGLSDITIAVLNLYAINPSQTRTQTAETLQVSPSAIGYHLNKLEEKGLIKRDKGEVTVLVGLSGNGATQ